MTEEAKAKVADEYDPFVAVDERTEKTKAMLDNLTDLINGRRDLAHRLRTKYEEVDKLKDEISDFDMEIENVRALISSCVHKSLLIELDDAEKKLRAKRARQRKREQKKPKVRLSAADRIEKVLPKSWKYAFTVKQIARRTKLPYATVSTALVKLGTKLDVDKSQQAYRYWLKR